VRRILIEVAERYERLAEMPEAYTMGRNVPELEKEPPPRREASGRRDRRLAIRGILAALAKCRG
jgi:hypothetical protein